MRFRTPPPPVDAPSPPRRSVISGLFGLTVVGAAAAASTVPDAWPRAVHAARVVAVAAGGLGGAAAAVWAVRAVRRAPRPVRLALAWLAPAAAGAVVWQVGGAAGRVTVCVLLAVSGAAFLAPRLRRDPTTEGDEPPPDPGWRRRVEGEWPATARAAGLVDPGDPELTAPLLAPVTEPAPAMLELLVGLAEVRKLPEDVRAAEGALRRWLRAQEVRVEPGSDDRVDVARLRAYRRHPMDVAVSWRDVPALDDPSGEWCPVGVDEWGRTAVVRWRIPLLVAGAQDSGKTVLLRAGVRGSVRQRIPVRWWLWDNRADFRDLRPVAHRYAAGWTDAVEMLRELDAALDERIASTTAAGGRVDAGYEWIPTLSNPADVLIVGELLTALDGPPGRAKSAADARVEINRRLRRRAIDGRAMAHGFWATAQTTVKEDALAAIRDLMPQKAACRLESESLVDPALGSGALEAGAAPHRIPAALPGVTVLIDARTKQPLYARSGFIPPAETEAAVLGPYRALMGRRLTVIDGELG